MKATKQVPFALEFETRVAWGPGSRLKPEEMPKLRVVVGINSHDGSYSGCSVSWNESIGCTEDPARLRAHAAALIRLAEELESPAGSA